MDEVQSRIVKSWSINCAIQFAQLKGGSGWTWDAILEEAEKLRFKAGF